MSEAWKRRMWKVFVFATWVVVVLEAALWFESSGVPLSHAPQHLREAISLSGAWGPFIILGLYAVRSFFLFLPTAPIVLVCGALYGPVWGTLLAFAGENLSAMLGFALARGLGRRYLRLHEHGWLKKYDEALSTDGFVSVLAMRLLLFPFDVVNIASGMSGMRYRQFAAASAIGMFPFVVSTSMVGDVFVNPRALLVLIVSLIFSVAIAYFVKRSAWAKRRLYDKRNS